MSPTPTYRTNPYRWAINVISTSPCHNTRHIPPTNMASERPATCKPKGACKYYITPQGCLSGESCRYTHGDPRTPFDMSKVCRYFTAGYCHRGSACWFKHVQSEASSTSPTSASKENLVPDVAPGQSDEIDDHACCICLERPVTFGLLSKTTSHSTQPGHVRERAENLLTSSGL